MKSRWENQITVERQEVADLFVRRRVDPAAFRARLEERIADRRAAAPPTAESGRDGANDGELDSQDSDPQALTQISAEKHSAFWRRVAAVLPLDAATGGVATGAAAAKLFGGKVLPAALAMPALIMAAIVGGFFSGAQALRRSRSSAVDVAEHVEAEDPRSESSGPSSSLVSLSLVAMALLFFTPWVGIVADVCILAMIGSMLSLKGVVRGLAPTGLLERRAVIRVAGVNLYWVMLLCYGQARQGVLWSATSDLGKGVAFAALSAAALACVLLGERNVRRLLWVSALLAFFAWINVMGLTFSTPSALRWRLNQMQLDPRDSGQWLEAAAIHRALVAVGAEPPALVELRGALKVALHTHTEDPPGSFVVMAADDMGMLDREDWRTLAQQRGVASIAPFTPRQPIVLGFGAPERVERSVLLEIHGGSDEVRRWLSDSFVLSWPESGSAIALREALDVVRGLQWLGREDAVHALRDRAHELLRDRWISLERAADRYKAGGFSWDPARYKWSSEAETQHAVELMSHVGVPDGIDIDLLRGYLRRECLETLLWPDDPTANSRDLTRAALLRVERGLVPTRHTWLKHLLDDRFALASLLLAALTIAALRMAPRYEGGALP